MSPYLVVWERGSGVECLFDDKSKFLGVVFSDITKASELLSEAAKRIDEETVDA